MYHVYKKDKAKNAQSLSSAATAINSLVVEWVWLHPMKQEFELANYLDIDPKSRKGEYKQVLPVVELKTEEDEEWKIRKTV